MKASHLFQGSPLLLFVLVTALALRTAGSFALSPPLLSDDKEYVELARSLTEQGTFALGGSPTAYRAPGYSFFLASIFSVSGESLLLVRLLQALLDTLTCFLVWRLASRYLEASWAIAAAAVYAVFPLQLLYAASAMSEALFTFLLMLSLVMVTEKDIGWKHYFMAGLIAGAATLARPTGLILPIIVLFLPAILRQPVMERVRLAGIFLAGMLIVVGPWLLRNDLVFDRITLTSHTGVNFWIGNHEGANGSFSYPEDNPLTRIEDEFERSDEGFRLGMDYVTSHPVEAIILAGRKFAFLFGIDYWILMSHSSDPEWRHAEGLKEIVRGFPAGSVLVTHIPVILITLLALYGFGAMPSHERTHWVFLVVLISGWVVAHLLFFGSGRLRFPLHPVLIVAAVYGFRLLQTGRWPETGTQRTLLAAVGIMLTAGWIIEGWTIISD